MNISTQSEMNVIACNSANAFKKFIGKIVITLLGILIGVNAFAQTYTDNASSYGGTWSNGSNNSSPAGGFGNWSITAGASSGVFIGNPSGDGMGTTGIGTTAFAMYATGSGYCTASRGITGGMQVGDVLTFYWAMNFDAGAGSKGFDLKSSGTTIFNVNNTGSATITTTNGTAFTAYGTAPMLVTVTRTSSSSYSFNMTARNGGAAYSTNISSSSSIDGLNFYIGNQNDGAGQKNIYLNAFSLAKPNQYRSKASGNWSAAGTWEISTNGGTSWSNAGAAPGSTLYSTITIQNTHTVSQDQNYSSGSNNNIVVASGGTLNMTGATGTFQFNTLSVSGTVSRNNASHVYSGAITINNGGKYVHAVNGGSVPTCTWSSGSTFEVTGVTSAVDFSSGSVQNYHHIVWNCTAQTSIFSFGGLTTINGNLTVQSTGATPSATSGLYFTNSTAITSTISGNLTVSGGFFAPFGSSTASSSTLNISGNLSISGGTFDIYRPSANTGTINLAGDFSMSGGTLTKGGTGTGNFNFSKSGTQTYSKSSGTISNAINFTVNSGSTLSMGTNVLDGSTGNFTLSSGGGLETGNTAGITTTGATGSIQVSGTRTYNTGANYTFNGSSAQATGAGFTGANNLTINNSAGVTLSGNASLAGTLTLTSGAFTVGSGNTITVSNGGAISRSSGSLAAGTGAGTFTFSGTGTVTGTVGFNNVNIAGGVNFGTGSTINGTLTINSGGFAATNTPSYGSSSTLIYNTTGSYGIGNEWTGNSSTVGSGVPNNVTIQNSTTLTFPTTNRGCAGNFNISSGGATLNGTSGDLYVGGNFTNSGTFTHSSRAVFLNGSGAQTLNGTLNGTGATNCFPFLLINNGGGVTLNTPVNVTNTLTLTTGVITTTSTNILNITSTATGAISGGGATSYISGPLQRGLPASLVSGSTYAFPVGKSGSGYYPISLVNPTTSTGTITVTAEAFAASSGGSAGTNLGSISTAEYWSVASSGNFTGSSISVTRPTAVSPNNAIGRSTTLAGAYASIGGTASGSSITGSSNAVGAAQQYFVLGVLATPTISSVSSSVPTSSTTQTYKGATITVTGTNLGSVTTVKLGGSGGTTISSPTIGSTTITFTVPDATSGGTVYISDALSNTSTSSESFTNLGFISGGTGNWNTAGTWLGSSVPSSGAAVTIANGHAVTLDVAAAVSGLTINTGGTFNNGTAQTLTINASGTLTNNGTFTGSTGSVTFAGAGTVSGTVAFNNVNISAGVIFGTASTINGTFTINSGGFAQTNTPSYGSSSTLIYNTTGSYAIGNEWTGNSTTAGSGVPNNVTIQNSTTLTFPTTNRGCAGNFNISSGGATLNATSGDLYVAGNFTNSGTFTHNTRALFLNGSGTQTLNGTLNGTGSTNCFPYLLINNGGGVTLNTPVNVTNTLTLTTGVITTTSTNILHITNTSAAAVSGGSSSSYISGPLRWSVSNGSGGDYKFHLGKSSTYLPLNVNNPTGTSPVITAEAFAANAGGSAGSGLSSLSTTEHWSVVNTGTLSAATISLAKTSLGGRDGIGSSTTLAGTYTNLGGSVTNTLITSNTVTAGSTVGSLATTTYFVLATKVAAPTITSFTPSSGYVGSTIAITGTNLTGATAVSIGGVAAAGFTVNSATSISATVAAGGATGTISVTTPGGTATSSSSFTFNGYISTQNGDWGTTSTWLGGAVPAASSTVTIDHAVTVNSSVTNAPTTVTINSTKSLTFGASGALTATTVTNGGSLVMTAGGTLTIAATGTLTNNATFTRGTGTVSFAGAGTVNGSTAITFNNLTINGTVTLTTLPTIDGTLRINGGNVSAAPIYTGNSTLFYNVTYSRFVEWSSNGAGTIGTTAGYPNNVTINAGTFTLLNGDAGTNRAINGTLTIASGATFATGAKVDGVLYVGGDISNSGTLNIASTIDVAPISQVVVVTGDVTNSGTITMGTSNGRLRAANFTNNVGATTTLSTVGGGDLEITGSLVDNGTFNANTRAVFFTGSGNQNISGSGTFNIDYIVSDKSGGRIIMGNNLLCEGPNTGNAITLTNTDDILDLNGFTLTVGKASVQSGFSGNGYIRGSATSNITILGTGAYGNLRMDPTSAGVTNVLNNLTINRTSTGTVSLGNNVEIGGTLTLTAGTLTVGANTLTYTGSSVARTSGAIDASNASATLVFGNTSALTLPSSVFSGNVNNLTMSGAGGITLSSATTVAGTLTLTTGNIITTSTNTFTLTAAATVSGGNSSSYVEGPLDRTVANGSNFTYPIGGATNYRPVILQSVVATGNPVVRVTMAESGATTGDNASIEATLLSARNWRLQTISGTFTSTTLNITETALVNGTHEIAKSNGTQAGTYGSLGTGQVVSGGAITSPASQTDGYYAIGIARTYSVSYDANGGSGSQSDATSYAYNATVTVKNAGTMTRTGYTFAGWNTAANGSGTSRAVASTFSIASDVILYAVWTVNSYTLSYNGNGNTGGTAPSSVSVNYNASTTISGNTGSLTKTGQTFAGWNTAADGSGDNVIVGSSYTMPASNVTLYAQWSNGTFEVDYDGNGFTGGSVPASGNYTFGATVTVSGNTGSLVRTGYTFAGWNTAANGSGTDYSGGATFSMPGNNVTLYAKWTVNSYTLTYSTNSATSGSVPAVATSYNYNALVTVLGNTGSLVRTGYTFGGWNTAADGSGTTYEAGNTFNMPAANTILYAKWDINSYTVTYDGNGATSGTAPSSSSHNYNSTVTVSANSGSLAKTGFTFGGWNTASDGTGTTYTAGSGTFTMGLSNVTLYAKWNAASSEGTADFRTNGVVTFTSPSNWQYNDGVSWVSATQAPTSTNSISIGHNATMNTDFTVGAGKTFTITAGILTINPGVTFNISNSTTNAVNFGGQQVILKSSALGTAAIGSIPGTNGAALTGATNVTVERYISARRKWRALAAPVKGTNNNKVYDNWQNGGAPAGNTGAIIWKLISNAGSENPTTGLFDGGVSANMLTYNSVGNSWSQVTNTKTAELFTSTRNNPYMLFVTGPYNISGTYVTSGAAATTLSANGELFKGDVTYSNVVGLNNFYMFANPYASAVNLKAVTKTNFTNFAYLWNPGIATVGGYVTVNTNTGSVSANTIQSGQAFFLQATSVTNTVTFKEADKVSGSSNTYFRTSEEPTNAQISIDLNKYVSGKAEMFDGVICNYRGDKNDVLFKLAQIYENLSIRENNSDYGVASRSLVNGEDVIQLRIWQMEQANYQFRINLSSMNLPVGSTAVLHDAYLNKETPLRLSGDNLVDFSVDAKEASSGQRFRIALRRANVQVTSTETPHFNIYPNPVVKGSSMQLEFRNKATGKYTVTVYTITGVQVQQSVVRHNGGTAVQPIGLDQRLTAGSYIVEVVNEKGEKQQVKMNIQ